ncbi:predicted protein [Chaetomium globosum CBS 148.51]|uniref:Uncharacterized protein n=1 Tax=Chaetomium globosum (strain ATCC 6205 / CBS 148.51 / DSM 1962 / NBRC 6347 / NRRL 1970) TaxID=306901 RepID=Q2H6R8_CHAGB|nr:uncharacterized protein CHGG_05647 [Chaetomium globosum CBS 148.51]EAQ89028.1 predicted protein [Chaetomium globosum CBS 148.51]
MDTLGYDPSSPTVPNCSSSISGSQQEQLPIAGAGAPCGPPPPPATYATFAEADEGIKAHALSNGYSLTVKEIWPRGADATPVANAINMPKLYPVFDSTTLFYEWVFQGRILLCSWGTFFYQEGIFFAVREASSAVGGPSFAMGGSSDCCVLGVDAQPVRLALHAWPDGVPEVSILEPTPAPAPLLEPTPALTPGDGIDPLAFLMPDGHCGRGRVNGQEGKCPRSYPALTSLAAARHGSVVLMMLQNGAASR